MRHRCRCLVFVAVVLAASLPAGAQPPVKTLLIVHGGPEAFPGNASFDATLRQTLFSHPTIEIDAHSEHLENEEFGEAAEAALRESIRLKFRNRPIDLAIANTSPALQFLLRNRDELFPNAPIVFIAAVPPPGLNEGKIPGVTGLLRNPAQTETLDLMLKLHPRTTRVHVVAYSPGVEGFDERVKTSLAPFGKRVTITYAATPSLSALLADIKTLPANTLIFYARYTPIIKGRVTFPDAMLSQIAEVAPVPIYSSGVDSNLGSGVVGGVMRTSSDAATHIGRLALRVLEGTAAETIPIEESPLRPVFDWRQLRRWKINESQLPENSEIHFRVPTVWELYASYIVGTLVVVAALLALIAVLLGQRTRLRRADYTIRASEASLRSSYERIRQLAGRLINAQETARAEIARDLHDDVCQRLAHVSLGVSRLRHATGTVQGPETQQALAELDRDTHTAFDGIRRLSHELHPATLRLLGLLPALRAHCSEVEKRHGVEVRFSSSENVGSVHPDVAVCLFRIAQESLRNGIVHGGAKHLTVTLSRNGDRIELVVTDDGRGFDVSAVRANGGGLGLVTMEERVKLVGGSAAFASKVGDGTTVSVFAPANQAISS